MLHDASQAFPPVRSLNLLMRSACHGANLVGLPAEFLASCDYNVEPLPLTISGVHEFNPQLFDMLAEADTLADAGKAFLIYMNAMFGVDAELQDRPLASGARRYRWSFLNLIRGWAFDSNGTEAAVLKGWVESRFGLAPTYHKEPIPHDASPVWAAYVVEKMTSHFHDNAIHTQLDLLYEFCQWAIRAFFAPGATHFTLHRGVNRLEDHEIVERERGRLTVRLNNLVSFTNDRDMAGCFGDTILTARVPVAKTLFFTDLLPVHSLKGEGEYLAIGGDYRAEASRL